ncbi:hypothetical protein H4R23_005732, partial [Coemansia sp. Cherry 401B]
LGAQDLVDTLEREFPALGLRPRQIDTQSISSLSVQASGGAPSETNGAARRGSVGSHGAASSDAASTQGPLQGPAEAMAMAMPPQGMLGMPPPHMLMPGMVNPAMGQVPPMGMMPMGFPPNMMFGMMPPPPPHGMYGAMPANVPLAQMGGDQLLMMKMMGDVPPGMYGQMSAAPSLPPHMPAHSFAMAYPNMPMTLPPSADAVAAAAAAAASQAPVQPYPSHAQQQPE